VPDIHPQHTLIQISDTHLGRAPGPIRPGYPDSDTQLQAVLADVRERHPDAALVLVTGDLAEDPETVTYVRLARYLSELPAPVSALAGNHDDHGLARQTFTAAGHDFDAEQRIGNWLIVSLNSAWPGHTPGHLAAEELARLQSAIRRYPDCWVLVAVHHPVVPVGSRWLDALGLTNGEELLAVLQRHPRVRACIFGHIHQTFDTMHGTVRLLGCPSTCVQFLPGAEDFALDPEDAGYRVIRLHEDGEFETRIERVADTSMAPAL
jgi:Icc protein